jgi:hypothetical protein
VPANCATLVQFLCGDAASRLAGDVIDGVDNLPAS